jgi:Flp pilus assembly pilin Flp
MATAMRVLALPCCSVKAKAKSGTSSPTELAREMRGSIIRRQDDFAFRLVRPKISAENLSLFTVFDQWLTMLRGRVFHRELHVAPNVIEMRECAGGQPVRRFLEQLWFDERGQDIAEYAVMLAVILVIVVGTIRLIGSNANNVFSEVSSAIQ